MHDLTFSVAEILGRPGARREWLISETIEGVQVALARLETRPVQGRLQGESVVEGVLVTGRLAGSGRSECARCLSAFTHPVEIELCELFAAPGHEGEEDGPRVQGMEIHLAPVIHDAFTLALPLQPLCSEGCKGLCASCGKDLNEGPCSCSEDTTDPRWAPLAALRDRLG